MFFDAIRENKILARISEFTVLLRKCPLYTPMVMYLPRVPNRRLFRLGPSSTLILRICELRMFCADSLEASLFANAVSAEIS